MYKSFFSRECFSTGSVSVEGCEIVWKDTSHIHEYFEFAVTGKILCDTCMIPIEKGDLMSVGKRFFKKDVSPMNSAHKTVQGFVQGVDYCHFKCLKIHEKEKTTTTTTTTGYMGSSLELPKDLALLHGFSACNESQRKYYLLMNGQGYEGNSTIQGEERDDIPRYALDGMECILIGEFDISRRDLQTLMLRHGAVIHLEVSKQVNTIVVGSGISENHFKYCAAKALECFEVDMNWVVSCIEKFTNSKRTALMELKELRSQTLYPSEAKATTRALRPSHLADLLQADLLFDEHDTYVPPFNEKDLNSMTRKQLQVLCKKYGIKANQKNCEMIELLIAKLLR